MTKLAASGLATALALTMLGGSAVADFRRQPVDNFVPAAAELEESTRIGQCRIQYQGLADEAQPAPMECEHAHWVAQRWGGHVMEKTGEGLVERATYEGSNDFTNVPAGETPRAGWCRAWVDGRAIDMQPEQSDCRTARRLAAAQGGRVLFMPL